jgi:hypothetical protein
LPRVLLGGKADELQQRAADAVGRAQGAARLQRGHARQQRLHVLELLLVEAEVHVALVQEGRELGVLRDRGFLQLQRTEPEVRAQEVAGEVDDLVALPRR